MNAGGLSTWHGDAELKRAILAQMATRREAPIPHFGALEVGDEFIPLYGWTGTPARLDLAGAALGLPQDLLELGWNIFAGFPDCDEAVAEEIGLKIDFLELIPVGVDASHVASRFVGACLCDRLGSFGTPTASVDRALIEAVGGAVLRESLSELVRLGVSIETRQSELLSELRRQWQGHESAESNRLQREWRVMDHTLAASRMFVDPRAVVSVITGALVGRQSDGTWDVDKDFERLEVRLKALLAELG